MESLRNWCLDHTRFIHSYPIDKVRDPGYNAQFFTMGHPSVIKPPAWEDLPRINQHPRQIQWSIRMFFMNKQMKRDFSALTSLDTCLSHMKARLRFHTRHRGCIDVNAEILKWFETDVTWWWAYGLRERFRLDYAYHTPEEHKMARNHLSLVFNQCTFCNS